MRRGKTLVVDPARCGCVDCQTHYSVPANELSEAQLAYIRSDDGAWVDRTYWAEEDMETWLARQAECIEQKEDDDGW